MRLILNLIATLTVLTALTITSARAATNPYQPYHALMACHFAQMHLQMATTALNKNTVATTRQLAREFQTSDSLMRIAPPEDRVAIGRLVDQIINMAADGRPDTTARQLCPSLTAYASSTRLVSALHTAGCIQQVRLMAQLYDKAQTLGGGRKGLQAVMDSLNKPVAPSAMWNDLERRGINPRLLTQMSLALTNQLLPVSTNEDLQMATQSLVQQCQASHAALKGTAK